MKKKMPIKMFNFFKKNSKESEKKQTSFEIELTASVLAYELARSDGEITQDELLILMNQIEEITKKVGKNKDEIFKIIKMYSEDSISFYEFVEDINKNYSKKEKLDLLKFLWEMAYADKKLDIEEERLIRRMADLIKIKDLEVLKLKSLLKPK